jgi:type I site-specific restriction endonuclease
LQTAEIFGPPVYQYRYRDAVIDGFLVDRYVKSQTSDNFDLTKARQDLQRTQTFYGVELAPQDPMSRRR